MFYCRERESYHENGRADCRLPLVRSGLLGVAADFYVSPAGDDANPGTREQPFASLARAREAVRQAKAAAAAPVRRFARWNLLPSADARLRLAGLRDEGGAGRLACLP